MSENQHMFKVFSEAREEIKDIVPISNRPLTLETIVREYGPSRLWLIAYDLPIEPRVSDIHSEIKQLTMLAISDK